VKVGDLVKFRTTIYKNIGIVVRINASPQNELSLYYVYWNDRESIVQQDGAYWKHELEVVSESR